MEKHDRELDYENQAFLELLSEDGIAIFARGLGLDRLFLKFLKLYSDPHNLVFVINTSSGQEQYHIDCLKKQGVEFLPKTVTNEVTSKDRDKLYLQGGVVFVTSRILVVDLLKKVCPVEKVSGILVYNAHKVTDSSSESFIIRLYRESNKSGFVKAFSDSPESFMRGFCQLERVMKNLFIRNAYLWPRFHAVVSASLQRHKPDVVELRQQMTPYMTAIQLAILDIMKACLGELKRANSILDAESVTVENCLGRSFDQIIKLHLDPIWHQLSYQSRHLVSDLKMLRTLLFFLTQYDCVTFYSYLSYLRSSGSTRAFADKLPWIFMEAASTLFVKSKERVFGIQDKASTTNSTEFLEESPKWHLLSMVLEEINKDCKERGGASGCGLEDNESQEKVLIVTNDYRTAHQLTQYLRKGGKPYLEDQFRRLLSNKVNIEDLPKDMQSYLQHKPITRGRGRPVTKKRKLQDPSDEEESSEDKLQFEMAFKDLFEQEDTPLQIFSNEDSDFSILPKPVILVYSLSSSKDPYHMGKVLNEIRPRTIIMYDADVGFVRQTEVYKACSPSVALRVYYLVYDSSVEEQKYLTSLRKEKDAFQNLIHQKAHMVIPADREGRNHDNLLLQRGEPISEHSTNNRKAGGQLKGNNTPQTVIVDMREFRSSLPSLLHKRGVDIIPVTLEVGDYVLSPDLCVERKSVSDLIGSLNSGRLYNQVISMTRYYKKPILLIEFEEGKPFSLQSMSTIAHGEVSVQNIASKLVLLTIHFPKLRILWCSSSHVTAELFHSIKVSHPQPSPVTAATVGEEGGTVSEERHFNPSAQDCLLKLPGINTKNYRYIMEKVKDFQELVSLSEAQLNDILGNDTNGKLLWNGLHGNLVQPVPTTGKTSNSKSKRFNKKISKATAS